MSHIREQLAHQRRNIMAVGLSAASLLLAVDILPASSAHADAPDVSVLHACPSENGDAQYEVSIGNNENQDITGDVKVTAKNGQPISDQQFSLPAHHGSLTKYGATGSNVEDAHFVVNVDGQGTAHNGDFVFDCVPNQTTTTTTEAPTTTSTSTTSTSTTQLPPPTTSTTLAPTTSTTEAPSTTTTSTTSTTLESHINAIVNPVTPVELPLGQVNAIVHPGLSSLPAVPVVGVESSVIARIDHLPQSPVATPVIAEPHYTG